MKQPLEQFIERESAWPEPYDDQAIDALIWNCIQDSPSAGDFACYLVHRLKNARHTEAAKARYEAIDESQDPAPIHYFEAIKAIRGLAEDGDVGAMFHMGKIYSIGIAEDQDFQQAEYWYGKAVAGGDVRACCNLGWLYQSGYGLPARPEEAFKLLSRGAAEGVIVAKATIGVMLLSGEGCEADPPRAVQLLEESFAEGYNNAGNCLADAYFAGRHLEHDPDKGFAWLQRVVERGDERTQAMMGHYLVTGVHGRTDVATGIAHLTEAMNRGYLPACCWLGGLYERGLGVEKNPDLARTLYAQGAEGGDAESQFALMRMMSGAVMPEGGGKLN